MSESTAHQYKFPIHPSEIQIESANNAVTSVVGVTDSFLIDIYATVVNLLALSTTIMIKRFFLVQTDLNIPMQIFIPATFF
jgi:hypothetical protein